MLQQFHNFQLTFTFINFAVLLQAQKFESQISEPKHFADASIKRTIECNQTVISNYLYPNRCSQHRSDF